MKLRKPKDLIDDPAFYFTVWRLVGAMEMLARYMQIHGDEKAKEMGERADDILAFFYEREQE